MDAIEKQIITVISKIKPFLNRDGGDIEYIGFRDGIVYVDMIGACDGCAYAGADITQGVETIMMEEVPGVIAVKIDDVPEDLKQLYEERKLEAYKEKESDLFEEKKDDKKESK